MAYDQNKFPVNAPVAGLDGSNVVTPLNIDGSGNLKVTGGGANASVSTDGAAIPASSTLIGASDGVNLKALLVDGSGNLKTTGGGGGGTQYTDGGTPPANPVGTALVFDNAGTWKDVSVADAFPVAVENANANGQTTMSASAPVVIASDQSKLPTKAASGDFAASSITDLATLLTLSGAAGDANTVNSFMGRFTKIRDLLLATLTVSVSNGNANGQTTMSASAPVVVASDQTPVPIKVSCVAVYSLASTTSTGATQNSGDLTVGLYREISIDINTTAQAGTSPTLQLFYERKAADGIYYVLWQSAVLTAATNTLSTSIGAGMAYNQSLGATGRLRWVVGGSATPTYTFSASISGK